MAAMCFVPPGFTNYLINERVNKEKRLQFICGIGTGLYWLTAFMWDMVSLSWYFRRQDFYNVLKSLKFENWFLRL